MQPILAILYDDTRTPRWRWDAGCSTRRAPMTTLRSGTTRRRSWAGGNRAAYAAITTNSDYFIDLTWLDTYHLRYLEPSAAFCGPGGR